MTETEGRQSEVEALNAALRTLRRTFLWIFVVAPVGLMASLALLVIESNGTLPAGFRILGWTLAEWTAVATLALLIVVIYRSAWRISAELGDQKPFVLPIFYLLAVPALIARRATALGMRWSGAYGPLKPVRKR